MPMSFDPRSREGSDSLPAREQHRQCVSIHAPARGATLQLPLHVVRLSVSIHAPARGATFVSPVVWFVGSGFDPRSREGSDGRRLYSGGSDRVSIHAPARGATYQVRLASATYAFRSTLPRGERQAPAYRQGAHRCFDPRSREGSDMATFARQSDHRVSIHAPARGATAGRFHFGQPCIVSIHAPARGAT